MSKIVLDAFAADLATRKHKVTAPSGDLGYGRDLSCTTGLTDDLAEISEDSPRSISQSTIRRLTTPRGGCPGAPDDGLDLRAYANTGVTVDTLRDLGHAIGVEIAKDDRIEHATVDVTQPGNTGLDVEIRIYPKATGVDPFALVFAVTESGDVVVAAMR